MLINPEVGDKTNLPPEVVSNQDGRDGVLWMLRKATPSEDMIYLSIVDRFDMKVKHEETPHVTEFLEYEYLLSYDFYTFSALSLYHCPFAWFIK